jgi:AcrR family transcriptional regulator
MSTPVQPPAESVDQSSLPPRPKRADARRNYDKVLAAAREAFAERGVSTSLEEIARQAEVGIGTLYRNFPTRQALLEAVYIDEVEALSRSAAEFDALAPWDAFVAWAHRLAGYLATKQALAHELLEYVDRDAPLFKSSRESLLASGQPLLDRAQHAGVVRPDTDLWEIIHLVGAIAKMPVADSEQTEHMLGIALDGLRNRASDA